METRHALSVCLSGTTAHGCCPLNWDSFGTNCYLFSTTPLSWHDARDWCNGHESHLVILLTDEEWVSWLSLPSVCTDAQLCDAA